MPERSPRLHRLLLLSLGLACVFILPAPALAAGPARQRAAGQARVRIVSIHRGRTRRVVVRVTGHHLVHGEFQLFLRGLPRDASARFQPRVVHRDGRTTLVLRLRRTTAKGSYRIRVFARPILASAARQLMPMRSGRRGFPRAHVLLEIVVRVRAARHLLAHAHAASTTSAAPAPADNGGPVPSHVPTWAYDDGCNGGTGASAALVAQWLTYAESSCGPDATKALDDCANGACTAVQYLDANWIYAQGSLRVASSASENWWLHKPGYSDAAHRVSVSSYGGGNLLNQSNPAVDAWFKDYVQSHYAGYPALMMDDAAASLNAELYYAGLSSTDEISSNAALQRAHAAMAAAMTHPDGSPFLQIDNALTPNPNVATPFPMLDHPNAVQGLVAEGAPVSDGTLTPWFSTLLDEIAYVDHRSNDFIALLSYSGSGGTRVRDLQAATEWLGYAGNHLVSWSDLETQSNNLSVWPEEGLVPTDPVQSMAAPAGSGCLAGQGQVCSRGGHNDLEVADGVYRREFGSCYQNGTAFGTCAALVNSTDSTVTVAPSWLTQRYSHTITFTGGDVESGGTVDLSGAGFEAGTSTIPAHSALLIAS